VKTKNDENQLSWAVLNRISENCHMLTRITVIACAGRQTSIQTAGRPARRAPPTDS